LVRGLDAFKWAIHDLQPVGNTLHIIDEKADSGRVFHIAETPIFSSDDLQSFADRHYRAELDLLCNFQYFLGQVRPACPTYESRAPRKRMNAATEQDMMLRFDEFKRVFQKSGRSEFEG